MTEKKSPYCGCLLYTANALSRLITKMADEEFAAVGLPSSYAFLLMTVHNNPGVQPSGISARMMLSPSTITRLVEKMEKQDFVKRVPDGKYTLIFPTQKTLDIYPNILAAWRALYKRYTRLLGEEEARRLTEDTFSAALKLENGVVTAFE